MSKENPFSSNSGEVYLPPELQQEIQRRLTDIESLVRDMGQVLGEHNCEHLLTETVAVKAAVDQVMIELLEGHMEVCMAQSLQAGKDSVEALEAFRRAMVAVLKHS